MRQTLQTKVFPLWVCECICVCDEGTYVWVSACVFVRGGHKTEISCNWSLRFAFAFWFCCGRIGLTVVMLHPTVPLPPFSHFPPISPVQLSFPVWLGQRANYPKYHILIYRVFRQLKFVLFFLLYCSRMNNKIRGVETKKKTKSIEHRFLWVSNLHMLEYECAGNVC